jgi:RNA-directed DNA polymerase
MSLKTWKEIQWPLVEKFTFRLQERIYKASLQGNRQKVRGLQRRLILSEQARALSVRRVTEKNRGRKTPGVDQMTVVTNQHKSDLMRKLRLDGKAEPIRRVYIPKPGKSETRPLGIPTIKDRAKQMLMKLALEPEWEAKFEANSYGFRPARCTYDAIDAIFKKLRGTKGIVLDADIRKCFDKIDHKKLITKLDLPPLMRNQIKAWLEADIMHGFSAYQNTGIEETTEGTPQGGIISPLLANIALHGMENSTKEYYANHVYDGPKTVSKRDRKTRLSVIRYADDFVIIAPTEPEVLKVKKHVQTWLLEECGLEFSDEKTKVKDSINGFNFLGFHLISLKRSEEEKYTFRIHISKASKKNFLTKTRTIFQNNKSASAGHIIMLLNPVITGWANYYKYCDCTKNFKQVEKALWSQLRAWVFRRKSKGLKTRTALKNKYFPPETEVTFNGNKHKGNWILVGKTLARKGQEKQVNLVYPSWIRSCQYVKISGTKSPFDGDHIYWSKRTQQYGPFNKTERTLLKQQNGRCTICKQSFKTGDTLEKDHIVRVADGGKDIFTNFQLIHRHCHEVKTRFELRTKQTANTREPNEAKVSRSDLKSSVGSEAAHLD